ncbi:MAG: hypothetical protein ACREYE_12605, partial [Gammaproteobacteria bacterium]
CAGVPARIFAATISCPSCTPKAATDDIKNLSGIHAGLPEGHERVTVALLEGQVAVELGIGVRDPSSQRLRPGEQVAYSLQVFPRWSGPT